MISLLTSVLVIIFFGYDSKSTSNQSKKQVGLYEMKRLCTADKQEIEKAANGMG